jgi:hypothetical protein
MLPAFGVRRFAPSTLNPRFESMSGVPEISFKSKTTGSI